MPPKGSAFRSPATRSMGPAKGRCCCTRFRSASSARASRRSRRRRHCRKASRARGSPVPTSDLHPIPEEALEERFLAATGPGAQNVNNVATAVQLRADVFKLGLSPEVFARLRILAGSRMTSAGEILITARSFRTQEANRTAARARLAELI